MPSDRDTQLGIPTLAEDSVSFGPFQLFASQRLLVRGDEAIPLGSRAMEILVALLERPGDLIEKKAIMALVWPDIHVVDDNLTVHVSALRRALGDGIEGNRYILTIPGRGYRFVAPVRASVEEQVVLLRAPQPGLPLLLTNLLGRDATLARLIGQVQKHRLVTVVGPGGVGKTTLCVVAAQRLASHFPDGIHFIELASAEDGADVSTTVAAALGAGSRDGLRSLFAEKKMLLLLDNCEQVIDAVASLAAEFLQHGAAAHILATSREPLHLHGEQTVRLAGLESPPVSNRLDLTRALKYPAMHLLSDRARTLQGEFALTDADASKLAEICRRLDGNPLAIELAAERIEIFGIEGLLDRLDSSPGFLAGGMRNAHPRQSSLQHSLDWSYRLLSEAEQTLLRRLSVFFGPFRLGDAVAVAAHGLGGETEIASALGGLVAKSLVEARPDCAEPCFRLLTLVRAYAARKLRESDESRIVPLPDLVRRETRRSSFDTCLACPPQG
jgi:predicted ATPase/DNA-binding winged helix-turn-helix (wHTH) protein